MTYEWISPSITGIFGIVLAIVAGILARRGSKLSAQEQRAPDVQELWAQQETDRRMRQVVEDMWLSLIHISEPTRRHHVSRMPSSA